MIVKLALLLVASSITNGLAQTPVFEIEMVNSHDKDTTFLPESVEKSNSVKILVEETNKNTTADFQKYKACIQRIGIQPNKLVSRDLNSDHYNHLNLQWNLRKEKVFPLAYFLPTITQDVANAVKCGLETEIHLVPNSGGHSYEAIGWGNNNTLVVDFRNMKGINIERNGSEAVGRIEPGALVGPVNAYFWENGGYAVPMGNCLTVGIGGHAIGGGIGYFATQYGLTIDNVIQYEIVDGRGQIVTADQNLNSDLFWALRGGGHGYFGIVTSLKVKLFEAHKIKITRVILRYHTKHFAQAYIAFQNMLSWIKVNEPTIMLEFMLASDVFNATLPRVYPGLQFSATHIQDSNIQPKGNASFLKALYETFPQPAEIVQYFPNYIQFVVMTGYAPIIRTQPTVKVIGVTRTGTTEVNENPRGTRFKGLPISDTELIAYLKSMRKDNASPRYFKSKSFFIKKVFTLAQMERVASVLRKIPQNNIWILCNYEQGRIQYLGETETAYVHRDIIADLSIHYEGSADPSQVQEGMKFLYELWQTLQFMDGGESYQNYPDLDDSDRFVRNYGQNLNRLIEQKEKWDPTNYFVTQISLPVFNRRMNLTRKCLKEGFFVDARNCNKFFRCVDIHQTGKEKDFVRYDFTCPPGQIFDEANSACNFPDRIYSPTSCVN